MSSNPPGVPKHAERSTSWKIPEGATHYVSPLPTEPDESDWQSDSYSDVDFYKERPVCADPSRKTWCRWSQSKKMFMYVEQDKPRDLLPLPQNVLHTHLLKSAYHVVVNGELVLYKESQELLPSQVRRMDEEPPSALNPPHKWAKEIKAWADGHTIQMRNKVKNGFRDEEDPEEFHYSAWIDQKNPGWWYDSGVTEYRVKPNVDAH